MNDSITPHDYKTLGAFTPERILITGGAGFIGSALVRYLLRKTNAEIINIDKLTYAGNLESLDVYFNHPNHHFVKRDICDRNSLKRLVDEYQPDAVMHLAAESHVDRSIDGATDFINTNVVGTYILLDVVFEYWRRLTKSKQSQFRFLHVSTDEVYGSLGETGFFTEETAYLPNSPYSASKAASDHLVRAWYQTYGLPVLTTNCSNNYGPYQFPEKLIPLMILSAVEEKSLPVYGTGENVRDWLYVDDHVEALYLVLLHGNIGETYNIGGNTEKKNIEVVNEICRYLDEIEPRKKGGSYSELITFVDDRPGHDLRYAICADKIRKQLGWKPRQSFETGLKITIQWYLNNREWCQHVRDGSYQRQRIDVIAGK